MLKDPAYTAPAPREQAEEAKQLAREARAAYMRRYRREHPDKIKRINEAYWLRRAIREARAAGWKGGK